MKQILIAFIITLMAATTFGQKGLAVGKKAPDFTGIDQHGAMVNLKTTLKKGNVVLIFYRGNWCPNCSRALSNIQDSINILSAKKITVIAVGPETELGVNKTVQKTTAVFSIISDKKLSILKKYDIVFTVTKEMDDVHKKYNIDVTGNNGENGNMLPVPSAFIINSKGIIIYRYFNAAPYSNESSIERITVKDILANSY